MNYLKFPNLVFFSFIIIIFVYYIVTLIIIFLALHVKVRLNVETHYGSWAK